MKLPYPFSPRSPVVSVVRLTGQIGAGPRGLSDAMMAPVIEKAFARKPVAVALVINSPGGSPVQSSLIATRIRRLAEEKEIPVHAFCEDVAASGGYWLAAAADHIWIDRGSILGSIGVIAAGFGLSEAIDKLGIERRVHTAGKSKSMLDPFRPEKPEDVERLTRWLETLHKVFIDEIKTRRGDRLADDPELFTGEVFIGQEAVDKGLADGIGHVLPVMRERFGADVKLKRYGPKRSLLSRFGAQLIGQAMAEIDERAAFARFGL